MKQILTILTFLALSIATTFGVQASARKQIASIRQAQQETLRMHRLIEAASLADETNDGLAARESTLKDLIVSANDAMPYVQSLAAKQGITITTVPQTSQSQGTLVLDAKHTSSLPLLAFARAIEQGIPILPIEKSALRFNDGSVILRLELKGITP